MLQNKEYIPYRSCMHARLLAVPPECAILLTFVHIVNMTTVKECIANSYSRDV